MDELFPIGAGAALGVLFALNFAPLRPWLVRILLIVAAGLSATFLSGEMKASWGFAVVDCGEVALSAWIAAVAAQALLLRHSARPFFVWLQRKPR